ncbi:MAG: hypothetical protein MI923_25925 [Phycisphaerales bacterium]|nr:hypothetical protein [Phycisphaerales bacterium]
MQNSFLATTKFSFSQVEILVARTTCPCSRTRRYASSKFAPLVVLVF